MKITNERYLELYSEGYEARMYGAYKFENLEGEEYEAWEDGYNEAKYDLIIEECEQSER